MHTTSSAKAPARKQGGEATLRIMFDNTNEHAICMLDTAGTVLTWNMSAERLLGYPSDEVLGNRVEDPDKSGWWSNAFRSFIAAGPLGNLVYTQATGKDAHFGTTIVEENMTTAEAAKARFAHLTQTVMPPLMPGIPYRDPKGTITSFGGGTSFNSLLNIGQRSAGKTLEVRSPIQTAARTLAGLDVRNATPDLYRLADAITIKTSLAVWLTLPPL
jgi:hypothetical protein